jgi:hypothetical protein
MSTTNNLPAAKNTATSPPVNGNGSALPNNNGFPPGIDGFDQPDLITASEIFREAWAARHSKTISTDTAEAPNSGCMSNAGVALTGARSTTGGGADRLRSLSDGSHTSGIPESVGEAYRRLVLNAPSLLPRCEMPVARMLFAEWWNEQGGRRK